MAAQIVEQLKRHHFFIKRVAPDCGRATDGAEKSGRLALASWLVGVDTGGTFTDLMAFDTATGKQAWKQSSSLLELAFSSPMLLVNEAVTALPATEPSVPPTPMKPNNRLACSLLNTSAMKHQNSDVTNRLNMLVHTKNARPVQRSVAELSWPPPERNTA